MPKEVLSSWQPGSQATEITYQEGPSGKKTLATRNLWPRISAQGTHTNEMDFIELLEAHGLSLLY